MNTHLSEYTLYLLGMRPAPPLPNAAPRLVLRLGMHARGTRAQRVAAGIGPAPKIPRMRKLEQDREKLRADFRQKYKMRLTQQLVMVCKYFASRPQQESTLAAIERGTGLSHGTVRTLIARMRAYGLITNPRQCEDYIRAPILAMDLTVIQDILERAKAIFDMLPDNHPAYLLMKED